VRERDCKQEQEQEQEQEQGQKQKKARKQGKGSQEQDLILQLRASKSVCWSIPSSTYGCGGRLFARSAENGRRRGGYGLLR
jgi:hypothetical protein